MVRGYLASAILKEKRNLEVGGMEALSNIIKRRNVSELGVLGMGDSVKCLIGGPNLALCRRFWKLGVLGMGDSVKCLIGGPNLALCRRF